MSGSIARTARRTGAVAAIGSFAVLITIDSDGRLRHQYGRYTINGGVRSSDVILASATTPTTSKPASPGRPRLKRLPSGFCPGHIRLAVRSDTSAGIVPLPRPSLSANARPRRIAMPSARKKSGATNLKFADGCSERGSVLPSAAIALTCVDPDSGIVDIVDALWTPGSARTDASRRS